MSVTSLRANFAPVLLGVVALAFIAFALPPYLSLDISRSRIPPPPGVGVYYPLLVGHVVFASLAMVTGIVQIIPALRTRFPEWHRRSGRVYIFAGVLPAGLTGLVIGILTPFGPVLRASNVLLAVLWLTCTFTGFRMARAGRSADHRRWMLRSVTLTLSIITNRVWAVIFTLALVPHLDTTFGGSQALMVQTIAGLSGWLGWVLPLLAVEWWLIEGGRRQPTPRLPRRRARKSRSRALPESSIALS